MYVILFHVGWLALIEIIFYFEYIGPLETSLYKDSMKNILNNYDTNNNHNNSFDKIIIVNPYNVTQFIYLNQTTYSYENNVEEAENNRLRDNLELYNDAIMSWIYFCIGYIIFGIFYICFRYYSFQSEKKRKLDSIMSASTLDIELVEQRNLQYFFEEISEIQQDTVSPRSTNLKVIQNSTFFNWKEIKITIVKKICHYTGLGICIIGFEYLFFTYIVLQYKVISNEELIYLSSTLIKPLVLNILQK